MDGLPRRWRDRSPDGPAAGASRFAASELVGGVGLIALVAGLAALRSSKEIGFDLGAAWSGTLAQLSVTVPAAVLVLAAAALELAGGVILARWLRTRPFDTLAEAAIAGLVGTTLKGALLIGTLAAVGLYRAPILLAVDLALLAAVALPPVRSTTWPILRRDGRSWLPTAGPVPWSLGLLVLVVWAGPILLQLASPVVPFIDVLPNYVGPAEHLRTFGWLSPLTETQSPIIGPSRSVLGYDALVGGVTTLTNLPAVLAASAYILPSALLVAAGIQRLARVLVGPDVAVGPWALLAFAVTESFARLADARGTVIVLPLVCFAMALAVERSRGPAGAAGRGWRLGPGLAMGLGLGAAVLVHPVIGAFAIVTVGLLALARPERLAPDLVVAGLTAGIIALPQLGVMLGKPVPTPLLAIALIAALAVGVAAARTVDRGSRLRAGLVALAGWAWRALVLVIVLALVAAAAAGVILPARFPDGLAAAMQLILDGCGVLLLALVLGWLVGSVGARSPVIYLAAAVGFVAVVLTQMLPSDLGFLGDALRFEVPKTVHYWIPVFASIGGGAALAKAVSRPLPPRPEVLARLAPLAAAAAIVVLAAYPARSGPIDAYHLGEHRLAEAVAIDLHYAGSGFWLGFPNSRTLVDEPRQELVDVIRSEIDAGRIRHDTPILHVARSFQEWVSTPLGVFDGVTETFASPDREVSHQTVGGRLFDDQGDLRGFLAAGTFPYVVLEPNQYPAAAAIRADILTNGYRSIFANPQGEVFVHG